MTTLQDDLLAAQSRLDEVGIEYQEATRTQLCSLLGVTDGRARTLQRYLRSSTPPSVPFIDKLTKTNLEKVFTKKHLADMVQAEIAAIKEELKHSSGILPAPKQHSRVTGKMLELHIPDLHVSKLAWALETGWENWDTEIAQATYLEAIAGLLDRTSAFTFDRIVLVIGSDMSHSDNLFNTTTMGTPQDVDGRYQKNFIVTRQMLSKTINSLKALAPVDGIVIPGNHDTLTSWHLGDSLECLYHADPSVTIENSPRFRKYYQWGKVMLMFAHGNKGKLVEYPTVMAVEEPNMWAATCYREAHTGDKHQLQVQEKYGVRIRISPALCPPDAWHSNSFYVGNLRSAEAFCWDSEEGLISQATYTIRPPGY